MAAAIAMMAGGAIVNAFAFSGSNYLFHSLEGNSAEERKRHDLAIEKLNRATEEWNEKRLNTLDFSNTTLQKEKLLTPIYMM